MERSKGMIWQESEKWNGLHNGEVHVEVILYIDFLVVFMHGAF